MKLIARRAAGSVAVFLTLIASLVVLPTAVADHVKGGPDLFIQVDDGTSIAVNIVFPKNFDPTKTYPAILEMAGYENGSSSNEGRTFLGETDDHFYDATGYRFNPPLATDSHEGTSAFRYDDDYVTLHASVRGTGCSSGEFDLFSWRSALDGKYIIDNWIVNQPWSNKKVGILGHSYSGITGFMVAATQPVHLTSISVSGLIDDLYRGITFPGGVSNGGFPVLWTLGVRPAYDVAGGTAQAFVRHKADPIAQQCAKNVATHRRTVLNDPVVQGINDTDNDWWRARALSTHAHLIQRPIHITGTYQDEQTGPRGFTRLWELVDGPSKRLLITNGDHGTNVEPDEVWQDRKAWMDQWMRGLPNPFVADPDGRATSVRTLFGMRLDPKASQGFKDSNSFPLEDTSWTPFFMGAGGSLGSSPGSGGPDSYSSGFGRQSWSYQAGPTSGKEFTTPEGPDELNYRSAPFTADTGVVGPITANLFISTTAPDTELFVSVIDEDPVAKTRTYLQRGMLRASHRAVDGAHSDFSPSPDPLDPTKPFLYRPHRPHTNPTDVTPGQVNEYLVEIFPVGHVFREGHRLLVKVSAPPRVDSYYAYVPRYLPSINSLHHSSVFPSRITLPVVPLPQSVLDADPVPCGKLDSVRCVTY